MIRSLGTVVSSARFIKFSLQATKNVGDFCSWTVSVSKSLSSLVGKQPTHSHLREARRLHAQLLVGGFLNGAQASHLVQVYVQLGSLEEALLIIDRAHFINNIVCNAILRAYIDSACFSEAIHFFNHLIYKLGFVPDNYTCPIILKACSGLCALDEGRKVNELIRLLEVYGRFKPNAYTKCALIDMFAKCGSLDEARTVFEDMSLDERDLASWTAMICGSIQQGQWLEALTLFKTMRIEGIYPDSVVLASLLPVCGKLEAKTMGMALQACALKSGFLCDLVVCNALMDMHCKIGDTHVAYTVFSRMSFKDDVSWSTLIAGYLQNCQYSRSLELYLEMINAGVKPSAIAVASILPALGKLNLSEKGKVMHGYIVKQGFDGDVVVGSALMDMYSNCGLMEDMKLLFSTWSDWDVMIWNSAISGHASAENFYLALSVFRRLWKSDFKPNTITLLSILPICTQVGALKQGKEVHCYAIKGCLKTSVAVSNSLIDMYCKCGCLDLGLKVFDCMIEKDIISYNTIISAYGYHGHGKQALALFDEMKSLAIKPSKVTFVGLLSACSHAGLVDVGLSLYISMIHYHGIQPNMELYSCMVDLLGRAGRIEDACNFVRMMPEEPDANVLGCLLAACRLHNKREPSDLFSKEIIEDKLEDSGYHILLSNMYASTKNWKDASWARGLIKEKGLRKKPGNSWIRIGQCTHVFDARDTTHPEFDKIREVIATLLPEMKKEWYGFDPCLSCS